MEEKNILFPEGKNPFRKWGGLLESINSCSEKHEDEKILLIEKQIELVEQSKSMDEMRERIEPLREHADYLCSPLLDILLRGISLERIVESKSLRICKFVMNRCKDAQPLFLSTFLRHIISFGTLSILKYFMEKHNYKQLLYDAESSQGFQQLLHSAATYGKYNMFLYLQQYVKFVPTINLLWKNLSPKIVKYFSDHSNLFDTNPQTSSEYYLQEANFSCVKILCEKYKERIDIQKMFDLFARKYDSVKMLKYFLQLEPKLIFDKIPTIGFNTCYRYLVVNNYIPIQTAIDYSIKNGHSELFRFCLERSEYSNEKIESMFYLLVSTCRYIFIIAAITEECEKRNINFRTERLKEVLHKDRDYIAEYFIEEKNVNFL